MEPRHENSAVLPTAVRCCHRRYHFRDFRELDVSTATMCLRYNAIPLSRIKSFFTFVFVQKKMTHIRRVDGILTREEVVAALTPICFQVTIGVHKANHPEQSHGRWEVIGECTSSRFEVHAGYPQRGKRKWTDPSCLIIQGKRSWEADILDKAAQVIQEAIQKKNSRQKTTCNFCDPSWCGWICHKCGRLVQGPTP